MKLAEKHGQIAAKMCYTGDDQIDNFQLVENSRIILWWFQVRYLDPKERPIQSVLPHFKAVYVKKVFEKNWMEQPC